MYNDMDANYIRRMLSGLDIETLKELWYGDEYSEEHYPSNSGLTVELPSGDVLEYISRGTTRAVWKFGEFVLKVGRSRTPPDYPSANQVEYDVFQRLYGTKIAEMLNPTFDYFLLGEPVKTQWADVQYDVVVAQYLDPNKWRQLTYGDEHLLLPDADEDYYEEDLDYGGGNEAIYAIMADLDPYNVDRVMVHDMCLFNLVISDNNQLLIMDYGAFKVDE